MQLSLKSALVTIVLAGIAGAGGMWLGGQFLHNDGGAHSLHAMVHDELNLTAEQERQLKDVEAAFAVRRDALEGEMRKANAELAIAIRTSEAAGPEVASAVQHFHAAMGDLQTETIEHVFAMRRVLTPEQRTRFDDKIAQALTTDAQ